MRTQVNVLIQPPVRGLDKSMFWTMELLVEKFVTDFENHCFKLRLLTCLYCCCDTYLQCIQIAAKGAISMPVSFLLTAQGLLWKRRAHEIVRSSECWGRSWRRHNHQLTHELDVDDGSLLPSPHHPCNVPFPLPEAAPRI